MISSNIMASEQIILKMAITQTKHVFHLGMQPSFALLLRLRIANFTGAE